MTLGPFLLLIGLGVVFALIWVWISPALALVLGIGAVGILLVVGMWLQAPLDQSLLGLVYRRRPEQPISALKHLIDQKQLGQPPESKPVIARVACSAANLFSASCPTPRWRCAEAFAFGFAFPTS